MSLLAPTTNAQPTTEDKINRQVDQLLAAPNNVKRQLVTAYKQGHGLLWSNQGGITPAQRIAELNERGASAEYLAVGGALLTFLTSILAGQDDEALTEIVAIHESTPAYTIDENGILTLE